MDWIRVAEDKNKYRALVNTITSFLSLSDKTAA